MKRSLEMPVADGRTDWTKFIGPGGPKIDLFFSFSNKAIRIPVNWQKWKTTPTILLQDKTIQVSSLSSSKSHVLVISGGIEVN